MGEVVMAVAKRGEGKHVANGRERGGDREGAQ